ncbi:uncharacterized protein PG986_007871 [Apiospora aurea]|uniref:FAD-binding domain-containing protein n=1 Tax=Apiospora aurea TaxID=335848 RepID=A0ABR1QE40_9PEZI
MMKNDSFGNHHDTSSSHYYTHKRNDSNPLFSARADRGCWYRGLALGQVLRKHGVSFEIFERSESRYARPEGWAVVLHALVPTPWKQITKYWDDETSDVARLGFEFAFYDPEVSMTKMGYRDDYREDGEAEVIRANRHRLRDWLLTNLPVQNGKQAVQVEETEDQVTVHFRDGTSATGDILVGADGVKSVVRKHLLKGVDQFEYDKISILTSNLRLEGEDLAEQLALGHSAYMVVLQDESRYLVTQHGAVHAIKDALSLGKALTTLPDSSRSTIATSLGSYQEVMLARGRQAAMESRMAFADPSLPKTMFARQVVSLPEDRITL